MPALIAVSHQRSGWFSKFLILLPLWVLLTSSVDSPLLSVSAQTLDSTGIELEQLKQVFREADSFSEKSGTPPVFKALRNNPEDGSTQLVGYVFFTPDFPPEEIGYSAPIDVLVGMDLKGEITGINVLNYRESYRSIRGDFLSTEGFQRQFRGKQVADGFRVGRDVDGVSRATITSWATSRGVRNAARLVAKSYLTDSQFANSYNEGLSALELLKGQSWQEMESDGLVRTMNMAQADGSELILHVAYMGSEELGEIMVGAADYSRAEREASNRVKSGTMVLVGIDGDSSNPFRQERLGVTQDEIFYPLPRRRFVYVGSAEDGKLKQQARFAGAMVMDEAIDVTRPFTIVYDTSEKMGEFASSATMEYALSDIALSLVDGRPLPAKYLPEPVPNDLLFGIEEEDSSTLSWLINEAAWERVIPLIILLTLVMIGFLLKSSKIRWLTLAFTVLYLGFFDGGFVSVSHITNAIKLGPSLFLNDLPLLLIIVFTLVTTLIWGRIFCSSLCPFGAVQDFITRLVPRRFQYTVPQAIHDKALYIKYGILALIILTALMQSEISIFQYFEPFGTLFFFSPSIILWLILIAFLGASVFIKRFYCRYACPLGAALGVVSMVSPLRIKRVQQCQMCKVCEHACPTAAIRGPEIDFKECVRCDLCEIKLIKRAGVCKHSVEEVKSRVGNWQPVSVS